MSILDGIIGGVITTFVTQAIEQQGGVQGLVSKFEQNGLGSIAQSWVGTGPNQPINPSQIAQVLGPNTVKEICEKLGMPEDQLLAKLVEHLPAAVDKMTPNGVVPSAAA